MLLFNKNTEVSVLQVFVDAIVANFSVVSNEDEPTECFRCENGKNPNERPLRAFFNKVIAPLYRETEAEADIMAIKPNEKATFAYSVIYELYRCAIEPNMERWGESPRMLFAVILTALYVTRHPDQAPFMCACQIVRLESYAPLCCPSLNPDRVRTFGEELELQRHSDELKRWSKSFSEICDNFCKA